MESNGRDDGGASIGVAVRGRSSEVDPIRAQLRRSNKTLSYTPTYKGCVKKWGLRGFERCSETPPLQSRRVPSASFCRLKLQNGENTKQLVPTGVDKCSGHFMDSAFSEGAFRFPTPEPPALAPGSLPHRFGSRVWGIQGRLFTFASLGQGGGGGESVVLAADVESVRGLGGGGLLEGGDGVELRLPRLHRRREAQHRRRRLAPQRLPQALPESGREYIAVREMSFFQTTCGGAISYCITVTGLRSLGLKAELVKQSWELVILLFALDGYTLGQKLQEHRNGNKGLEEREFET